MKCVSIVYKRPSTDTLTLQFKPVRPIKRSVDQYMQKLKQKQFSSSKIPNSTRINFRSSINTAQTSRPHRIMQRTEMTDSMNVVRLKYSVGNVFKTQGQGRGGDQEGSKTQRKFRSTVVRRKEQNPFYSLKGIKLNNDDLFVQSDLTNKKNLPIQSKNTAKLLPLKRLKPTKPKTILISIDFILNEHSFWQQERIDDTAHKNWKILSQHSNIVWLTRRQNSLKKLQRYATEHGLRLDGVYKITPVKRSNTLMLSLSVLQKDLLGQFSSSKSGDSISKQVIMINSLKVDEIKDINYEQFYNLFPVAKTLRCIVHFIQVDMSDKMRFNSPLKVLSKQKLPHPNSINHLFMAYYNDCQGKTMLNNQDLGLGGDFLQQQQHDITTEQMMEKYEQLKESIVNYFGNHLKISLNKKLKLDSKEASVQYVIGDMLKRNFRIMHNYHKQSQKIHHKLEKIKEVKDEIMNQQQNNDNEKSVNIFKNNFVSGKVNLTNKQKITIDQLLNSKLLDVKDSKKSFIQKRAATVPQQQQKYYKDPVFLWKK